MMAGFVKVAQSDEIAPDQGKMIEVGGKKIALFNVEGSFYAIDDTCTHRGGPLSEGSLDGKEVTCPWHGAIYDVITGEVLSPPAPKGVARYNVRVEGTDIEVEV
jgi:nitrite reductase (NADH) small subunit/3-phenylpropionate/trans-cinnamate dioxygenase ferredoxin subunit